ncbi:YwaF family protein [Trichococcus paludicola]|uniref:YwaF family protein n=1 Tax=Trichococcus paludicola TaxID=2052942 RepID=UPI000D3A430D|nr:TIGR02206 family membrane protein [Trichococcus paludicola]
MSYFWTFESDLPSGMGVETFSSSHIIVLVLSAIIIYSTIHIYRKQADLGQRNIKMTIAALLIMLYFSRWIWCAFFGNFSFFLSNLLPLHLCSASAIMGSAAVYSNNRLLKEFMYGLSLPGGLVAMANPNLGTYPLFSFNFVEYALTHLLLILLPLLFVFGGGFRPDFKSLPHSIYLAAPFIGVAFWVNQMIGSNYMFLNRIEKGTVLVLFDMWLGTPGYLMAVLGSIFIVWAILYTPWEIPRRRNFSGR